MKDKRSYVMLHENNSNVNAGNNDSLDDQVIIVLGFFGASPKSLAKKYGHLGERFQKDVLGIVFPWRYMYFEERMGQWVKSQLNSYVENNPEKKSIILLVSSGGGTVMYLHFLKWAEENTDSVCVKSIMWEYGPGSIGIPEYYRAASRIVNRKKNFLISMVLFVSIIISCKICDLLTDYSGRVRQAPWSPELVPKTVCVEYSISNKQDPILDYSYVEDWIKKMKSIGRDIKHHAFDSQGHLNAMKSYPQAYLEIWESFMKESGAL